MSREFNGSTDDIVRSIGALSGMTYGTIVALVKFSDFADFRTTVNIADGSDNPSTSMYTFTPAGQVSWTIDGVDESEDGSPPEDGWCLIVSRKASGTVEQRCSIYDYGADSWSHADGANAVANATAPGAGGTVSFKFEGITDFFGLVAAEAVWADSLPWAANSSGDAAIEAAGLETALSNWDAESPDAGWAFNQASVSDPVTDWTGGGADQTSISGTTVSADEPPGFSYDLGTEGEGASTAPAGEAAAAGAVTVAGAAGATAPAGQAAGTSAVTVAGSSAGAAPPGLAAGTGTATVAGSVAATAPAGAAAGAATTTATGSSSTTAPAGLAAAAAAATVTAAGASTAPAGVASGTGGGRTAVGASTAPAAVAAAAGTVTVAGSGASTASAGSGAGTAQVTVASAGAGTGWGSVPTIRDRAGAAALDRARARTICPNDHTPYETGPRGQLYCPWDGFRPDRGW